MARFSVIIPAYQAAGTICRAIDSALAQTLPPHEVVICDDGSTDGLDKVLATYRGRVVIVRQENGGLSSARNRAIEASTGSWVVLLDADDEWLPTKLQKMAEALTRDPTLDIVATDALVRSPTDTDRRWYGTWMSWPSGDQCLAIIEGNFIFASAAIRRESLDRIGGFTIGLPHDSEYEGWVRLILSGSRAGIVEEALSIYHVGGGGQLSSNRVGTYRTHLAILDRIECRNDAAIASAVAKRRRVTLRRLAVAEGVAAMRGQDRATCLRLAVGRHTPLRMRLRTSVGVLSPSAGSCGIS